ncbi:unnamed protein product [Owenia fusiformis]|uniref:Uncharacterized protein n=1 Tax=Owenia fusiformis TaxID=6347 RepID=A0A8J1XQU3_OWEFU|nr:unnamed protein product [Owenia fusiformis]
MIRYLAKVVPRCSRRILVLFLFIVLILIIHKLKKFDEYVSKDEERLDSKLLKNPNGKSELSIKDNRTVSVKREGDDKNPINSEDSLKSKTDGNSTGRRNIAQIPIDVRIKKLPGAVLIGVQKCGTGALKTFLNLHPNIRVARAEPHFFDWKIDHNATFEGEMKRYLKLLPRAFPNETVLEKTPEYFDMIDPFDLFRMNPALKLILLVCDPVRRTISAYLHNIYIGMYSKHKSFEEYVFDKDGEVIPTAEVVRRSIYDEPLKRHLKYFPRKQFLIMENTFLLQKPTLAMQEIEKFLEIPKFYTNETFYFNEKIGYYCINPSIKPVNSGCQAKYKYRVHPNVSEENLLKLRRFFQPNNDNFIKLVGNSMPSLKYFP